jgi:hypothetical protein
MLPIRANKHIPIYILPLVGDGHIRVAAKVRRKHLLVLPQSFDIFPRPVANMLELAIHSEEPDRFVFAVAAVILARVLKPNILKPSDIYILFFYERRPRKSSALLRVQKQKPIIRAFANGMIFLEESEIAFARIEAVFA